MLSRGKASGGVAGSEKEVSGMKRCACGLGLGDLQQERLWRRISGR